VVGLPSLNEPCWQQRSIYGSEFAKRGIREVMCNGTHPGTWQKLTVTLRPAFSQHGCYRLQKNERNSGYPNLELLALRLVAEPRILRWVFVVSDDVVVIGRVMLFHCRSHCRRLVPRAESRE
jgi:hypothetical protein